MYMYIYLDILKSQQTSISAIQNHYKETFQNAEHLGRHAHKSAK